MAKVRSEQGFLTVYDGTREGSIAFIEKAGIPHVFTEGTPVLEIKTDRLRVGQSFKFSKIYVDLSRPSTGDTGKLILEYWEGHSWVYITKFIDGTAVGPNTMRQSGYILFDPPHWWKKLNDSSLFYVRFRTSDSAKEAPVCAKVFPDSGQYITVPFTSMIIDGPLGRPRPIEVPYKARFSDKQAFVQKAVDTEALNLDIKASGGYIDVEALKTALWVGKVGILDTWPFVGKTTKTMSYVPDGSGELLPTQPLADPFSKTIDVRVQWCGIYGDTYWEWREVYFPPEFQEIDSSGFHIFGGCYGAILNGDISAIAA